jgi:ribose-phosphate pyrophosphokinase
MLKIFSGTSNSLLSQKIGSNIGVKISKSEVVTFDNSEIRVCIQEDVKNDSCVIIQSTSNPTNSRLMELFLTADALKREEARKIIAVIPYFGYARQDLQHRPGECVSANVVIRFLESIGVHKVYTIDLHDEATQGVFNIPFKNLSALPLLAAEIKKYLSAKNISTEPKNLAIISPDQGGIERARKFGEAFYGHNNFDIAVTEKRRDLAHIHQSTALNLYGEVNGRHAIIVDDIVTSGRTLVHASEFALAQGANSVTAAISHRDFGEGTPNLLQNSQIEKFFTTNTINIKPEFYFDKMVEVDISGAISDELKSLG